MCVVVELTASLWEAVRGQELEAEREGGSDDN
jgi:hypothetical protein